MLNVSAPKNVICKMHPFTSGLRKMLNAPEFTQYFPSFRPTSLAMRRESYGVVAMEDELVSIIPPLRAYARSLTKSGVRADDLVQDSLERALRYRHQFIPGSSLRAWVFRIMRNKFADDLRAGRWVVEDIDGERAATQVSSPEQQWRAEYADLLTAVHALGEGARDAILLVLGAGLTHEEAAEVCDCPLGTLKSRVRRARAQLISMGVVGET